MSKIALVLEGGGMRGIYTSGVLDFFLDQNWRFQNIIGYLLGRVMRLLTCQIKKAGIIRSIGRTPKTLDMRG